MPLKKRKQEVTQSYATIGVAQNTQIAPGPEGKGGSAGRKIKEHENPTVLCHDLVARLPSPQPGTERGGRAGRNTQEPPQTRPKNSENVSRATIERPDHPDQPRH